MLKLSPLFIAVIYSLFGCSSEDAISRLQSKFSGNQVNVYAETAGTIATCYELYGIKITWFAEDSMCGEVPLWELKAQNAGIKHSLKNYKAISAPGVNGPSVGEYYGQTSITSPADCTFDLSFTWTGEDISGEVVDFYCQTEINIYAETASAIAACYEQYGIKITSLAEDGMCGETPLWELKTTDTAATHILKDYRTISAPGIKGKGIGEYSGETSFTNHTNCNFTLSFTWTGEDISGDITDFDCQ